MRVNFSCGPVMMEFEHCLTSCFLLALFGVEVSSVERQIFALPLRYGGLGITNLVTVTDYCYESSLCTTAFLQSSILGQVEFELDTLISSVFSNKVPDKQSQSQRHTNAFDGFIGQLDSLK